MLRPTRIAIVAPASPIDAALAEAVGALARARFADRPHTLVFHPQCFQRCGHFAGDDEIRARALIEVANDPAFDAVWFARGGYGSFRLLERVLPALAAPARAKTYLGYSDLGALLAALYAQGCGRPVHGPMPTDLRRAGGEAAVARALAFLLGDGGGLEPSAADGPPVAAFNITILAHLIGTPWLPDLSGHVLMLEEVSEPLYRIDRCLGQIASAPALRGVAGIRLGRCADVLPNDPVFGLTEEEIVRDWCGRAGIAYLGRADIGHDPANKIVPFGPVTK